MDGYSYSLVFIQINNVSLLVPQMVLARSLGRPPASKDFLDQIELLPPVARASPVTRAWLDKSSIGFDDVREQRARYELIMQSIGASK